MNNLYFNNYEDFACNIADKYESIRDEEYNDVAVVAKYEEARRLIKELLCNGYDLHSIEMHDEEFDGYDSEYIVSLFDNEIWCEPMKRKNGYITDDSPVIYILDNCSSKVIPCCKGKNVYEVSISDDSDEEHDYAVNGEKVDKETFDEYVSKFVSNKVKKSKDNDDNDSSTYNITIKGNLDMGDAEKIIEDMERRMAHMQEMIDDMHPFRRLFMW